AVATGNEGNSGIRTPGDCPSPWRHPDQTLIGGQSGVVSVGATDYNNQPASFSSRGPATWQLISPYFDYPLNPGIGLIKPDIAAPGVDIVSLSRASDNVSYATMSGTSMATPAVAGVMALMYSKKPTASPEEISQHLELSALALAAVKNNTTGSGRVDALAALNNLAAHISILDYTIDGDSEGHAHAGQTINLGISLINYGVYDIQNVQASLASNDPYVSILNNSVNYGDIDGLETAPPPYGFVLGFAPHTPQNHSAHLVLELSASGGLTWEQELYINVQAPYLELLFPILSDPLPGGNANGIAEADENLDLIFPIINSGGSPVQAFTIQIQSLDNLCTINGISNNEYASLPVGEILYPSLQLSISSQAATGDEIRFSYSIHSTYYEFSGIFSVAVGGVNTIQVGAGNLVNSPSEASPINIHYRSLRGQAIYTSNELHQAGYVSQGGALIRGMAYYVEAAPLYPLPDFVIRIK
ncbi:MAG: S8 family serine peptidase, partial [Candidatus Cloacimonadaceae bacterium]|nr:S8 family serine peptidase [Candidatus Cloacimonadaceae bacterium]